MTLLHSAVGLLIILALYRLYHRRGSRISIADIPGPEPESFILGNLRQFNDDLAGEVDFKWQRAYGNVVRFKGSFGEDRLLISDAKALQYIHHTSGYDFPKQKERREISRMLSGRGLLWSDGETHRRQRKIMNPAFGTRESKAHVPVFNAAATMVTNKWKDILLTTPNHETVFDLTQWISKATLDAMGIAAFDYHFGAFEGMSNELGDAFTSLVYYAFGKLTKRDILTQSLTSFIPLWIHKIYTAISTNRRYVRLRSTAKIASKVAKHLIDEKSLALSDGKDSRDALTLLIKANLSEKERSRMSEEEMIAQMRTLLLAGYDATAMIICFMMLELARHPDVQNKLRDEIREKELQVRGRGDVEFTADDFESMPYLIAVTKECLRYHPTATYTYREAVKDDVLPLETPITTLSGKIITELPISKGTKVVGSINGYNRQENIYGSDAHSFDPDRWLTPGRMGKAAPVGAYANLFTFSGGVRSCIGWRFAVYEMQAFMIELISHFEFGMSAKSYKVRRELALGMTATVEGEGEKGSQLPLLVKLVDSEEQ